MEALVSLQRRSLIETRGAGQFTLQPVIMEYVTNNLTKQAYEELIGEGTPEIWTNYALMKAQAKDYVRDSQVRLILGPIARQLLDRMGKIGIEQKLNGLLAAERLMRPQYRSYLGGNVLNLLVHLGYDLQGADFSSLTICQAYLQNVVLHNVNFANAHFEASVFSNPFGNVLTVVCSPQGELLAAGIATGDVWIFRVPEGTPWHTCRGHADAVWCVAFSPDGRVLASSSDDHTIRLWDVNTGQCLRVLRDHSNRVRDVAFNADGSAPGRAQRCV